jgi:hypothetical protein
VDAISRGIQWNKDDFGVIAVALIALLDQRLRRRFTGRGVEVMDTKQRQARINEIKQCIAEISAELKRPMSNIERRFLYFDRKDLRDELKQLEYEITHGVEQ